MLKIARACLPFGSGPAPRSCGIVKPFLKSPLWKMGDVQIECMQIHTHGYIFQWEVFQNNPSPEIGLQSLKSDTFISMDLPTY